MKRYYQRITFASHLVISLLKIKSILLRKKKPETNIASAKLILMQPVQQSLPKDEDEPPQKAKSLVVQSEDIKGRRGRIGPQWCKEEEDDNGRSLAVEGEDILMEKRVRWS